MELHTYLAIYILYAARRERYVYHYLCNKVSVDWYCPYHVNATFNINRLQETTFCYVLP